MKKSHIAQVRISNEVSIVLRRIGNEYVCHYWNEVLDGYSNGIYCDSLSDGLNAVQERVNLKYESIHQQARKGISTFMTQDGLIYTNGINKG